MRVIEPAALERALLPKVERKHARTESCAAGALWEGAAATYQMMSAGDYLCQVKLWFGLDSGGAGRGGRVACSDSKCVSWPSWCLAAEVNRMCIGR